MENNFPERDMRMLILFCRVQFFSLIFLQKFAIPFGPSPVSVPLVVTLGGAAALASRGVFRVDRRRMLIYLLFACLCTATQLVSPGPSWLSFILITTLNCGFVLSRKVPSRIYFKSVQIFIRMMYLPAMIVLVQRFCITARFGDMLNMEKILPSDFMLPGYMYASEFGWATGVIRPNGFFFLEPSFASGFLAAAAIVEMLVFKRKGWVVLFSAACISTYGATGMIMLGLAALGRMWQLGKTPTLFAGAAAAVASVACSMVAPGVASRLRLDELTSETSSGYDRLVKPLLSLLNLVGSGDYFLFGMGAGAETTAGNLGCAWPIVKVTYEYGFFATLSYIALIYLGISRAPMPLLMLSLMGIFQFTGGNLLQPIWIGLVLMFCSLFVLETAEALPAARPDLFSTG